MVFEAFSFSRRTTWTVLPLGLRARGQPFLGQSIQGCLECDFHGDGCGTFSFFPIAGLLMSCISVHHAVVTRNPNKQHNSSCPRFWGRKERLKCLQVGARYHAHYSSRNMNSCSLCLQGGGLSPELLSQQLAHPCSVGMVRGRVPLLGLLSQEERAAAC